MQVLPVIDISSNTPVTLKTVTSRNCSLFGQKGGQFRPVGIMALETSFVGKTSVGDTLVCDVKMAFAATLRGHFGCVLMRVVAVGAVVLFKCGVQVCPFCLVGMAIGTFPAAFGPEQFPARRRVRVVAATAVGTQNRFPMPAALQVLVALEADSRDLILEHSVELPGVRFVAVTAIVLSGLMPVFAAEERIVTVEAEDRLFGRVGVWVVAFITVRFEYGWMDHRTFFLLLMA